MGYVDRVTKLLALMKLGAQGASANAGFYAVEFFSQQPNEMGLWPRGVLPRE